MARLARISDVEGMLSIQRMNLLSRKKKMPKKDIGNEGFLLFKFSRKKLGKFVKDRKKHLVLVQAKKKGIVGYMVVHDLDAHAKRHGKWFSGLKIGGKDRENIAKNKTFLMYQSARKPGEKGVGRALMEKFFSIARKRKYRFAMCEIAKSPLRNRRSEQFHKKLGFAPCGHSDEVGFRWTVLIKTL